MSPSENPRGRATPYRLRGEIDGQDRTFPLLSGWSSLGTSRSCDLVLPVKGVSRLHARVLVDGETLKVEDRDSSNGTFVNGTRLREGTLRPGQTLRLGPLSLLLEEHDPDDGALGLALDVEPPTSHASASLHYPTSRYDEGAMFDLSRLRLITAVVDYLTLPEADLAAALARTVDSLGGDGAALIENPGARGAVIAASAGTLGPLPTPEQLQRSTADRRDPELLTHRGQGTTGALYRPRRGPSVALWMWHGSRPDPVDAGSAGLLLGVVLHLIRRLDGSEIEALSQESGTDESPRLTFPEGVLPGRSPAMVSLYQQIGRLAVGTMPILILGETGVGKEHLAKTLHLSSDRASGPFVAVNCAAIPDELLEAEMFGIGRGVATGVEAREGKFQQASGGTLFLDEIGDMPLPLQAKLLRALQDGQVHPVGRSAVTVEVRIVAATHSDLDRRIKEGLFRSDLYYRLAGYELEAPPLRRRTEDIPGLLAHFLRRFTGETGKRIPGVSIKALRALTAYPWPGNVRELEHEVRRLVYLTPDGQAVDSSVLSPRVLSGGDTEIRSELDDRGLDDRLEALERDLVRAALAKTSGNQTRAAELLKISRGGLIKRMKRLGIHSKRP